MREDGEGESEQRESEPRERERDTRMCEAAREREMRPIDRFSSGACLRLLMDGKVGPFISNRRN